MKFFAFLGLVLVATRTVGAQTPTPATAPPPLPAGPLIKNSAPDLTKWTVTTGYSSTSSASSTTAAGQKSTVTALGTTATTTKTGTILEEEIVSADGHKQETWYVGTMVVALYTGSNLPGVSTNPKGIGTETDFTGFNWISAKNYTGIQKLNEVGDCLVFRDKVSVLEQARWQGYHYEGQPPVVDAVAYISLETRLPVQLQIGDETRSYHVLPPPGSALVVPPAVQAAIAARQKKIQAATVHFPHP